MKLGEQQQVVIDGTVVQVTEVGDSVFRAAGTWYSSFSGAELDIHMRPFGPQLAFPIESTNDLGMDTPEWRGLGDGQ